jgi:hypothetical protein
MYLIARKSSEFLFNNRSSSSKYGRGTIEYQNGFTG